MIFEDLAGEKYEYKYEKDAEEDKNKVIDYGIKICKVDSEGKEKGYFLFVRRLKKYTINNINNNVGRHYLVRKC